MNNTILSTAEQRLNGLIPYRPGKSITDKRVQLAKTSLVKLANNENPLGPSPLVIEAIQQTITELRTYPDANGLQLKQVIANYHDVDLSQIVLGNGSEQVMALIASVFSAPGDEIIVADQEFIAYYFIAKKIGARPVVVPSIDYEYNLGAMLAAITPQTRLIFIANPRNPTGMRITRATLVDFLQQVPNHVLVVLDEAYSDYVIADDHPQGAGLLSHFDNLIVTRTFSKLHSLAGLRIGYSLSHPQIAGLLNKARMPFNVNKLGQVAAAVALQDGEHIKKSIAINEAGKTQLCEALEQLSLSYLGLFGNFVTIALNQPAQAVYDVLVDKGVVVCPLEVYGMPDYLRVTVGTEAQNAAFIEAFTQVTAGTLNNC